MRARALLLSTATDVVADLDKMWERARVGLALTKAYYEQKPCSIEEIAVSANLSQDTIRRTLAPLVNIGRAERVQLGRRTKFMATENWANRTAEVLGQRSHETAIIDKS